MDDTTSRPESPSKADTYQHDSETLEVVFAREGERILTVREYPNVEAFEAAVSDATYTGEHDAVVSLAPPTELTDDSAAQSSE